MTFTWTDTAAIRDVLAGQHRRLISVFPWAQSPQGGLYWAERESGSVALSGEDKAFLKGLLPAKSTSAAPKVNTQVAHMIEHMQAKGYITHRDAHIDYGVQAFSRRMKDIRELGYKVRKEPFRHPTTNAKYFRYSLAA